MTESSEELSNIGVYAEGLDSLEGTAEQGRTLIVLGAPRGGTSAIAGALAEMGIYMGRGAAAPVFESLALANAIEGGQQDKVRELIADFNREHRVWGFKRPGFTHFVDEYHGFFRNPVYLVILRDPAATANRGMISGRLKANYLKKIRKILATYEGITNFVESNNAAALFISYEKLLLDPKTILEYINELLGLNLSADALERGERFVSPSPEQYLEVSRAHRIEGEWLEFTGTHARGWARYVNKSMDVPPRLLLYEGEKEISATSANLMTVLQAPDGEPQESLCGFEFDLTELAIVNSSNLRIRAKGEIRDLTPPAAQTRESLLTRWKTTLLSRKARR